jgi:hypothetical protein
LEVFPGTEGDVNGGNLGILNRLNGNGVTWNFAMNKDGNFKNLFKMPYLREC